MNCSCGFENPQENNFCGRCGERLYPAEQLHSSVVRHVGERSHGGFSDPAERNVFPNAVSDFSSEWLAEDDLRSLGIDRPAIQQTRIPEPVIAPPLPPIQSQSQTTHPFHAVQTDAPIPAFVYDKPTDDTDIHGPSFLGLSSNATSDYLLEEPQDEAGGRGKWVALLILAIVVGLGAWKWEMVRGYVQQRLAQSVPPAPVAKTIAAENGPPASPDTSSVTPPAAATGDTPAPGAAPSTEPASATPVNPSDAQSNVATAADATKTTPAPGKETPATASETAAAKSTVTPPAGQTPTTAPAAAASKPVPEKSAKEVSKATPVPAAPTHDEQLLVVGEQYFYGRGVPKDCNQALVYFRAAADQANSRALSHLGAMYATGQCVQQNRSMAYNYFARAAESDHKNPWLQRNMEMLWRDMDATERQAVLKR